MKKNKQKEELDNLSQHNHSTSNKINVQKKDDLSIERHSIQENSFNPLLCDESVDPNFSVFDDEAHVREVSMPVEQEAIVFQIPITKEQIKNCLILDQSRVKGKNETIVMGASQILGIGRNYEKHQMMVMTTMIGFVKRLLRVQLKE